VGLQFIANFWFRLAASRFSKVVIMFALVLAELKSESSGTMNQLLIDNKCVEVTDNDVLSVLTSKIGDIIPEVRFV